MEKRLLITGFDPFGGETVNPAWEAVKLLPDTIGSYILCKLEIPTVFGLAAQTVLAKAAIFRPDVILCIGQAGGRACVTPERIGINLRSARIPDNEGNKPQEERIVPGAVSNSAGTFVCNDTLYLLLHHYAGTDVQVGFIHVPYLPEQGQPSLSLSDTAAALEAAIRAI